jgi:hypothetical protein
MSNEVRNEQRAMACVDPLKDIEDARTIDIDDKPLDTFGFSA